MKIDSSTEVKAVNTAGPHLKFCLFKKALPGIKETLKAEREIPTFQRTASQHQEPTEDIPRRDFKVVCAGELEMTCAVWAKRR